MGVRGLQYYMEQCCPEASPYISIPDIIARRRSESYGYTSTYRNDKIIIVVDGSNCIREIYGDLEWIGGAQLNQYAEKAKRFVDKFKALGVHLVFFFDGPTIQRKRKTWVERRYSTLGKIYYVLDEISSGVQSKTIPKTYFHLPPGMGQLSRVIFQDVCQCEVYQSLKECDEEIADYARIHNAFAIIGQDTDYVILDSGQALYLSIKHLNLDKMTTRLYDKWQLARALKIDPSRLPFLATFMGNDVVSADDLKPFHLEVTRARNPNQRVNFASLVPQLANYIRSLRLHRYFIDDQDLLANIAHTVLKNHTRDLDIRNSLLSYDPQHTDSGDVIERSRSDNWSQILAEARRLHVNHRIPSMVYSIMSGLPFESSTSVEDFRTNDLPSFAEATLALRQRIYGILLQEKPLASGQRYHVVEEWCMAGPGSLDQPNLVTAVFPRHRHPGLKVLWREHGRGLGDVQWQLFLNTISQYLEVVRVRNTVPLYLIIPTLILYYLNENFGCLAEWEVDVMLSTATCLKHYSTAQLASLPADPLSIRGVRVANFVMRCTFIFYFLLASCGYPFPINQAAPWLFFDGKLFQKKYREADAGSSISQLCEHKVDVLEHFHQAKSIIFPRRS